MLYLYHVSSMEYYELKEELSIGRTTGTLIYSNDLSMSGKHALITVETEGTKKSIYAQDLGSKNLIKVNRILIPANHKIKMGLLSLVEIGSQDFIVSDSNQLKPEVIRRVLEMIDRPVQNVGTEHAQQVERDSIEVEDVISKKEAIFEGMKKELAGFEKRSKEELVKLNEIKEVISQLKSRKEDIYQKMRELKIEIDVSKAEREKIRIELENKKMKIINLKDLVD